MKAILLAGAAIIGIASAASATNIITFSQTSQSNTVIATTNGANTQTTLSIVDAALSIGQILGGSPPATAFLDMTATSNDPAVTVLTAVIQHYDGSFCITTAAGCGGTNILSGTFTDAAFGGLGGPGLAVNVNNPPDTLVLSSAIFTAADLAAPNSFGLGLTNLTPVLAIAGTTIAAFDASFAGTVSASATPAAEPVSLALLGVGILGIALVKGRRQDYSAG